MSTIKVAELQHLSNSNNSVSIASDSSVTLKHSGNSKIATTATGVSVTGTCAATTLSGSLASSNLTGALPAIDGSALTGLSASDATKMPLTGGTFTGSVVFADAINENVYTIPDGTSSDLDPDNGMIQIWTLGANRTATESLTNGQSMMLMVGILSNTLTWPTITWVGGSAPTLSTSSYTVIEFWKAFNTLWGAAIGDV